MASGSVWIIGTQVRIRTGRFAGHSGTVHYIDGSSPYPIDVRATVTGDDTRNPIQSYEPDDLEVVR